MRNRKKIITIKSFKNWRGFVVYIFWIMVIIFFASLIFTSAKKEQSRTEETNTNSVAQSEEEPAPTEAKEIVCLDPGHGGKDVGAIYGSILESNINLDVALQAKSFLENDGYTVYLTRDSDTTVAKRARARYCNSINADILVSIHHNTYSLDHTVDYGTALYYKESDQLLASSILNSTSEELAVKNQGIAKFDDSLLWIATMPAALSEAFFITNKNEYALLTSLPPARLTDEARGITEGIVNYFTHPEEIEAPKNNDSLNIDRIDLGD